MNNTKSLSTVDLLATTACSIALDNNVDLFICLTDTGKIARFVSKYRPFQPILACSTSSAVVR
jgi:pyruvate kinase